MYSSLFCFVLCCASAQCLVLVDCGYNIVQHVSLQFIALVACCCFLSQTVQGGTERSAPHMFYLNNLLKCVFFCIVTRDKVYSKQKLNILAVLLILNILFVICLTSMFTSDEYFNFSTAHCQRMWCK